MLNRHIVESDWSPYSLTFLRFLRIWYIIIGFIAGCVAKALMHMHLSITWTIVLGIVGSIVGGAVTHLFSPPSAGGRFHPAGLIVSILGAIAVLYVWHRFRLQIPRG